MLNEGRITEELIEKLGNWQHSGFHVFCGEPIDPGNETSMENLARYISRASLSRERMTYVEDEGKVIYQAKDGSEKKEFTALEWLANICSHIPNPREHMIRYYGQYSNAARGKRQKSMSRWQVKRSSAETGRDLSKKFMRISFQTLTIPGITTFNSCRTNSLS